MLKSSAFVRPAPAVQSKAVSSRLTFASWMLGVGAAWMLAACGPSASQTAQKPSMITDAQTSRVRSFSDSRPVSCLAAGAGSVWAGTPRGLVRWSLANETPTPTLLTTVDGLPDDKIRAISLDEKGGVWVSTPKGVGRYSGGNWSNYPRPPVGDLIVGIVATPDGDSVWVGGSDGIAFLRDGQWERYAVGTTVTAMAGDGRSGVWIGTSGKGVLRIVKDDLLTFGMGEGNDIDTVRAMVSDSSGALLAVGEGPGGQRVAFFDGNRFWSYKVALPGTGVVEWVQRIGTDLLLGSGPAVWSMKRVAAGAKPVGPLQFQFSGTGSMGAPKAVPLKSLKPAEEKPAAAKARNLPLVNDQKVILAIWAPNVPDRPAPGVRGFRPARVLAALR